MVRQPRSSSRRAELLRRLDAYAAVEGGSDAGLAAACAEAASELRDLAEVLDGIRAELEAVIRFHEGADTEAEAQYVQGLKAALDVLPAKGAVR